MTIERAQRKGTPSLIGLWGPSASGKTYSALLIARGLVGPSGKIGMIDTENRRGEFYAELAGGWDHLDFQPPFHPDRYRAVLKEFETAGGYGCIIIDSTSHIWAGEGGVLEMADENPNKGPLTWKKPKMAYNRWLNNVLRAPYHIIFCLRTKDAYNWDARDKEGKKTTEKLGHVPICGPYFIYEMTVSVLLGHDHKPNFDGSDVHPLIPSVKAPEAIYHTIKSGEFLSEANGEAITEWVSGGAKVDEAAEALKREARDVATTGEAALDAYILTKTRDEKAMLKKTIGPEIRTIAKEADRVENPDDDAPADAQEGDGTI